ncbi:hypothetical protein [Lysobacter enzymogenes]|uniref:hypothetical protein n=1 Tax=Lysobacter enzymogenes TaxID=69 RepID=UPI001A96BC78|nr:hypothetical protein [Lysobacter enzymogenes]QQP95843.1 hypothetical protein JHW38_21915 [Lysobacter enzymogenes]
MPDRHHNPAGPTPPNPPPSPPTGWADAFAALPAETPPADGWARIAARLPAARAALEPAAAAPASAAPRMALRRRWALAAMLAAALPLGLWLGLRAQRPAAQTAPPALATQNAPAPGRDSASIEAAPTDTAPRADANLAAADTAAPGGATGEPQAAPAAAPGSRQERRTADLVTAPQPAAALDPPQRRAPRSATATDAVASAVAAAPAASTTSTASATSTNADSTRLTAQLRELQAESSQLEALVAAARDDRVASAASAVMGAGLDQRLRLIDTALADATLPADTRVALWRERVDSLRSLAGMESSQRWYAARGERYDGALVRVD